MHFIVRFDYTEEIRGFLQGKAVVPQFVSRHRCEADSDVCEGFCDQSLDFVVKTGYRHKLSAPLVPRTGYGFSLFK